MPYGNREWLRTYDQRNWAADIAQFENFKNLLDRANGEALRAFIIRRMRVIKDRWPQHINERINDHEPE